MENSSEAEDLRHKKGWIPGHDTDLFTGKLIQVNYQSWMNFPEIGHKTGSVSPPGKLKFWKNIWMSFPGFANKRFYF